jgi:hypothetical protein
VAIVPAASTREERVARRMRNPKWRLAPYRVEMAECINCDTCRRQWRTPLSPEDPYVD